jgi:hypothetical protein
MAVTWGVTHSVHVAALHRISGDNTEKARTRGPRCASMGHSPAQRLPSAPRRELA